MILPPPCFTAIFTCFGCSYSLSLIHAHTRPSELQQLIFVSSDHITRFQSSIVQSRWALHQASRFLAWVLVSFGFLGFLTALRQLSQRVLLTVSTLTTVATSVWSSFRTFKALSTLPTVTFLTHYRSSADDIARGWTLCSKLLLNICLFQLLGLLLDLYQVYEQLLSLFPLDSNLQ